VSSSVLEEHSEEVIEKPLLKKFKISVPPFVSRTKEDSPDYKRETLSVNSSQADTKM